MTNGALTQAIRQKMGHDEEAAAFLIGTLVGIGGLMVWGEHDAEIDPDGGLQLRRWSGGLGGGQTDRQAGQPHWPHCFRDAGGLVADGRCGSNGCGCP